MGDHDDAVGAAVRRLVDQGTLDERQAEAVLAAVRDALPPVPCGPGPAAGGAGDSLADGSGNGTAVQTTAPATRFADRSILAEIAGYLGGAFVAGAVLLFAGTQWDRLSRMDRIVLLLVAAVVLTVAGAAVGGGTPARLRALGRDRHATRRRLVATLFLLASAAVAGVAAVACESAELAAAGVAGLAVGAVAYALVPSLPGQLGCWFWSVMAIGGLLEEAHVDGGVGFGFSMIGLGAFWALLASRVFVERYVGFGVAAGTALFGAQAMVVDSNDALAYIFSALIGAVCMVAFVRGHNWVVLAVGVLAVTLAVPEALHDWTNGSLGAASALLAAGVALLGASAIGLLLRPQQQPDSGQADRTSQGN